MDRSQRFTETIVLIVAILGTGMVYLDQTAVNVALPALQNDLNADIGDLQWIVDIYILVLAILLLIGGVLGDRYGRVRVFIIGMIIFLLGSVGSGLASDTNLLILARAVQGLGGSLLVPGSLAIINATVVPERRGQMLGLWGTFSPLITIAGPVVGGWLVDTVSWRAVFLINLPLGLAAAIVAYRYLPESRDEEATGSLDWAGVFTLMIGLGSLLFAIIEGPHLGWGSPLVLGTLIAGIVGLIAFVIAEAVGKNPLIPLHLFRNRSFSGINLMTLVLYIGLGAPFFFLTLNLQQIQGYTAAQAGLATLPIALSLFVLARLVGGLSDKYGPMPFLVSGTLVVAVSFFLYRLPTFPESYWTSYFPAILLNGIGLGLLVVPLTVVALGSLPQRYSGVASGFNNAVSRISQMLSIAVFGVLMTNTFSQSVLARVADLGLSAETTAVLAANIRSLGETAVPPNLDAATTAAIEEAIRLAFVDGFRLIMLLSAVCAVVGLAFGVWLIRYEANSEGVDVSQVETAVGD
ncbi:MAG: DHA2 family efflux MFS transporter permease subunit [Chloroflexota bacterium]